MIRINVNITIVDMVKRRPPTVNMNVSECFIDNSYDNITFGEGDNSGNSSQSVKNRSSKSKFSLEKALLNKYDIKYDGNGFNWDEYQQGLVLGSFFWLHWVTQIPGGILARKYGTKLIFGLSNLISCLFCFLMPILSYWDYRIFIFSRVLQGLISGLAWPAMHNMTALWIPPNERSKFVTAYLGSSVGIAVTYPLFGYIISWSSWEWVFHVCGFIGIIWYLGWYFLVFDTPAKHPRIDSEEREYIEKSLGNSVQETTCSTPWRQILTSRGVWMTVVAQWGGIWGLFTLMAQAPTYFKYIHGWNIQMTGILSGLPHMMRMIFAYFFSIFGDFLLRKNKLSRTNVRKMAGFVCCVVKGLFVLALAFSGCNTTLAIVFLTLATAVHGAVSTGPLANVVDLSPNFAGVLLGLSGMIGVLPGFISPVIVGLLTLGNQTVTQWQYVFLITAAMLIGSGMLYLLFGESTLQSWNTPNEKLHNEFDDYKLVPNLEVDDKNQIEQENSKKKANNLDAFEKEDISSFIRNN